MGRGYGGRLHMLCWFTPQSFCCNQCLQPLPHSNNHHCQGDGAWNSEGPGLGVTHLDSFTLSAFGISWNMNLLSGIQNTYIISEGIRRWYLAWTYLFILPPQMTHTWNKRQFHIVNSWKQRIWAVKNLSCLNAGIQTAQTEIRRFEAGSCAGSSK